MFESSRILTEPFKSLNNIKDEFPAFYRPESIIIGQIPVDKSGNSMTLNEIQQKSSYVVIVNLPPNGEIVKKKYQFDDGKTWYF